MQATSIKISSDGNIVFIYSDGLLPVMDTGNSSVKRVSHVEPCSAGGWCADMSPVGGPVLGPYTLRSEALQAEVEWLEVNLFGGAK